MLQSDPDKRPTAQQALEHEWFKCDRLIIGELLNVNQAICSAIKDVSNIDENDVLEQSSMYN